MYFNTTGICLINYYFKPLKAALGFSLLEVLIALVLFSLILLGLNEVEWVAFKQQLNGYYKGVAQQQLSNIEQRLIMIGEKEVFNEQVARWNQENREVLPLGEGKVWGVYPHYKIQLTWKMNGQHLAQMQQALTCLSEDIVV